MNFIGKLLLGALFGWILGRAGVAEYNHIEKMFLFQEFHMFGVLGLAVTVAGILLHLMRQGTIKDSHGQPIPVEQKKRHPGNIPGGLLFGAGWALTGACPGTSLVQFGTGHTVALATMAGIMVGIAVYRQVHRRFFHWETDFCG